MLNLNANIVLFYEKFNDLMKKKYFPIFILRDLIFRSACTNFVSKY